MVFFEWPIFTELILPFVLVFVLVFAILQKSKVLGEGKAQVDALVALAIGLILVAVPPARDFIILIVPWLAVAVVVMLVFLILYGFVGGDLKEGPQWMKIVFGILAGVFVLFLVAWFSGFWDTIVNWFTGGTGGNIVANIIMLLVIGGAIAVAVATGKKSGSGG
jgi:hypothetical protein